MKSSVYYCKKAIHISSLKLTFPVGTKIKTYERGGNNYVEVSGKEYARTFEFEVAFNKGMLVDSVVERIETVKEVEDKKLYEIVKSDEDAMERQLKIPSKREKVNDSKAEMEVIKESTQKDVRGFNVVSQIVKKTEPFPEESRVIEQDGIKVTMTTAKIGKKAVVVSGEESQGEVVKNIGNSEADAKKIVLDEKKIVDEKALAEKKALALKRANERKALSMKNREKAKMELEKEQKRELLDKNPTMVDISDDRSANEALSK